MRGGSGHEGSYAPKMGIAALLATQHGVPRDVCMRATWAGRARLRRNKRYGRIPHARPTRARAVRRGGMRGYAACVDARTWYYSTKFSKD